MPAKLILYKRHESRWKENMTLDYETTTEAIHAAKGLLTLGTYDCIEVRDDEGFIRGTWTRDPRSGLYQVGF